MQRITGFILAVYNFFVGDPIILGGIAAAFVVVGLLAHAALGRGESAGTAWLLGALLVVGAVASLGFALRREITPKQR